MSFFWKISAVLIGVGAIALSPGVIMAQLSSKEVCGRAKEFTVLVQDSSGGNGSGVIYKKEGNTYFVLTNYHVVETQDSYRIQTPDGNRYPLEDAKEAVGYDLAVLRFVSDRPYTVAQFGNSQEMSEGATVYATGFPGKRPGIEVAAFSCTAGQLDSRLPTGSEGYTMIYSNQVIPGMSGGPVLDESSRLVGVNGGAIPVTKQGMSLGALRLWIPIDTLSRVASWRSISLLDQNASNAGEREPLPSRRIPTWDGLATGSVERQNRNVPPLTPEQEKIISNDLYYQNRISTPCNTPGVLRDNDIEGVPGYTACFLPASN